MRFIEIVSRGWVIDTTPRGGGGLECDYTVVIEEEPQILIRLTKDPEFRVIIDECQ